jgi:multicomponent Na+:H+ antiporter subunit E
MFVFWMLLSGEFHFILISSGIVFSLFVAYISHDLLIGKVDIRLGTKRAFRFLRYLPWLLRQLVMANLDLAYRTLHPRMPIDPQVVKFDTPLKSDIGIAILANSITLTPGTVTIEANREGEFIAHTISKEEAEALLSGEMQSRVARIEGE